MRLQSREFRSGSAISSRLSRIGKAGRPGVSNLGGSTAESPDGFLKKSLQAPNLWENAASKEASLTPAAVTSIATEVILPGVIVDLAREEVRSERGERLELRPRSFAVLRLLATNAGQLVSKQAIMEAVWDDAVVTDDALT